MRDTSECLHDALIGPTIPSTPEFQILHDDRCAAQRIVIDKHDYFNQLRNSLRRICRMTLNQNERLTVIFMKKHMAERRRG